MSAKSKELAVHARPLDFLPEVGLAAIVPSRKHLLVHDFVNFVLDALSRNTRWLNASLRQLHAFQCALLVGDGPNKFRLQDVIYPTEGEIAIELQIKNSDDYDTVALAIIIKMTSQELSNLLDKLKYLDESQLKRDLCKGKSMGVTYALLRPVVDGQYRVAQKLEVGNLDADKPKKTKGKIVKSKINKKDRPIKWSY